MFLESSWKPGVVYGDLDHAPHSLPGSRTGAATAELRDELTDLIHEQTCVAFLHPPLVILGRSRSQERTHPVRSDPAVRGGEITAFKERLDSEPPQSVGSTSIRMSPSGSMKTGFQAEDWICPMTCQSSESPEAIEDDRRADDGARTEESDESRVAWAMKELRKTGWYWGSLTANEAKEILQDSSEGTFLLRDSSQVDYLFTISTMTSAGPTNLRIEFRHGKFKLDSVVLVKPKLKQFDSVVHLVEHYVQLSRTTSKATTATAGPNGTVQLLLTKPVYTTTPSLQHLCRIIINRTAQSVQDLPIPSRLKDYMTDYTYNL